MQASVRDTIHPLRPSTAQTAGPNHVLHSSAARPGGGEIKGKCNTSRYLASLTLIVLTLIFDPNPR